MNTSKWSPPPQHLARRGQNNNHPLRKKRLSVYRLSAKENMEEFAWYKGGNIFDAYLGFGSTILLITKVVSAII